MEFVFYLDVKTVVCTFGNGDREHMPGEYLSYDALFVFELLMAHVATIGGFVQVFGPCVSVDEILSTPSTFVSSWFVFTWFMSLCLLLKYFPHALHLFSGGTPMCISSC